MIKRKRPVKHGDYTDNGRRPKSEGKLRCKSGISVRSDIGFSLEKESASYFPFLQVIITIAAALSGIYMLQSYYIDRSYELPISRPDTMFLTIAMTALSALMISRGKPFFKIAGFAYLIMNVIYIVSHSGLVALGFKYACNTYCQAMNNDTLLFNQSALSEFDPAIDLEAFIISLAFIMTLLCAVACIINVNFPILFLVTFFMFEVGAMHGWRPAIWTVVVMIICWVTILSISLINHTTKHTSKSNFAVSLKKKSFYLTSNDIKQKFFSTHALTVIAASTAAFVCALTFYGVKGNYHPDALKLMRRANKQKFDQLVLRVQKGTFRSPIVPGRAVMVGGTNGGQMLGSTTEIHLDDNVQLKVACDDFKRPIYLRGYAGEVYEPNSAQPEYYNWDPIELDKKLTDAFAEFGAKTLDYNYLQNIANPEQLGSSPSQITVTSINAAPNALYAPVCAYYSGCDLVKDETQDFDGMITPNKVHQSYTLDTFEPDPDLSWDEILEYADYIRKTNGFEDNFSFYSDYIYSKKDYTDIPADLEPVITNLIKSANVDTQTDSVTIIITKIKRYLAQQGFTYTTNPGVTFDGGDFIKQFLEKKSDGKGFCQHYASAGVMIMRRLGYPARYAEGYVIAPKQKLPDRSWVSVTTRCAHAWCEVYIEGFGWYPIEFTPGYTGNDNPNLPDKEQLSDSSSDNGEEISEPEKDKKESSSEETDSKESSSEESSSQKAETPLDSSSKSAIKIPKLIGGSDSGGDDSEGEAAVEYDDNGGGGFGGGNDRGTPITRGQITYMLMMTLFVIGFAAAVVVRRRHILNELEQSINSRSGSKSVISCYTALLKYISLLGIKNDNSLTDVQLSSRITTELGVMSPELNSIFMEISEPAITCYMSGIESDSETAEHSRKLLKAAQKNIFERLSFFGKLSARWISGLY
ncbi:MAG: transglutaminase-like domain-containing protein [Ruminococcus sp.]|nr:transglutaminase-like domain-containing protein [Ruminococcus sp.]